MSKFTNNDFIFNRKPEILHLVLSMSQPICYIWINVSIAHAVIRCDSHYRMTRTILSFLFTAKGGFGVIHVQPSAHFLIFLQRRKKVWNLILTTIFYSISFWTLFSVFWNKNYVIITSQGLRLYPFHTLYFSLVPF